MIQRQVYQWLKTIAENINLTPVQVENLTKAQALTYISNNYPEVTQEQLKEASYFFNGIKEILLREAKARQLTERLLLLKSQLETAYPESIGLTTDRAKEIASEIIPYLYGEIE